MKPCPTTPFSLFVCCVSSSCCSASLVAPTESAFVCYFSFLIIHARTKDRGNGLKCLKSWWQREENVKDKTEGKEARMADWLANGERLFSFTFITVCCLPFFTFLCSVIVIPEALRTLWSDRMARSQHVRDLHIPERLTVFMGGGSL